MSKVALLIDDDEGVRLFVSSILENAGWRCIEAYNGEEGYDRAEKDQPDLIILDVMMPVQDGFETFKQLRSSHFTEKIPIIMLTGVNEELGTSHDAQGLEDAFGVNKPEGYVDKPVDPDLLLNTILGVIG